MKESEAREHLQHMMFAIQKYRSIIGEVWGDDSERMADFLKEQWPWVFGDKCPLPTLSSVLDRDHIEPLTYFNLMTILHRFMPEVISQFPGTEIPPEPDMSVLGGWD